jgi:hypothetical protein
MDKGVGQLRILVTGPRGWRPVSGRNFLEAIQNDFLFLFVEV